MTSYPFVAPVNGNFQFQPTLDGTSYLVTVTWNLWACRYYVTITTLQGVVIVNIPLIGSPPNYAISMTAGYFDSTLVYLESDQTFVVSP